MLQMITDGLIDVVCPLVNPKNLVGDKDADIDIDFADRTPKFLED